MNMMLNKCMTHIGLISSTTAISPPIDSFIVLCIDGVKKTHVYLFCEI